MCEINYQNLSRIYSWYTWYTYPWYKIYTSCSPNRLMSKWKVYAYSRRNMYRKLINLNSLLQYPIIVHDKYKIYTLFLESIKKGSFWRLRFRVYWFNIKRPTQDIMTKLRTGYYFKTIGEQYLASITYWIWTVLYLSGNCFRPALWKRSLRPLSRSQLALQQWRESWGRCLLRTSFSGLDSMPLSALVWKSVRLATLRFCFCYN